MVTTLAVSLHFAARASSEVTGDVPPTWDDLRIGEHYSIQPAGFQEFACGTNGGPPSIALQSFAEFANCPAEETGLHEVSFRYDDEHYYEAIAVYDFTRANALEGTRLGNFPIVLAGLFDDAGTLRGIRIVTDDRVPSGTRQLAYSMANYIQSYFGSEAWDCADIPAASGETAVGNLLIKRDCSKTIGDEFVVTTSSRLLRRPGQSVVDPANGQLREGYFESTARIEVFGVDSQGQVIVGGPAPVQETPSTTSIVDPLVDPVEAFLVGASSNCPGCDLANADLKRRDLVGADLSGADLHGVSLHRANLAGANLDGADLTGANLNLADLKRASLRGADLTGAFLYLADAAGADFRDAVLDAVQCQNARFTAATMSGVTWQNADAMDANVAGADLRSANLTNTLFAGADLQRAVLVTADLTDASFYRARMVGANLTAAIAVRAIFVEANLTGALVSDADLTDALLVRARTRDADFTGAILTGAQLPDGRLGQ